MLKTAQSKFSTLLLILLFAAHIANTNASPLSSTSKTHGYEILANDSRGKPVEGAVVSFDTSSQKEVEPAKVYTECTTDVSGTCRTEVENEDRWRSKGGNSKWDSYTFYHSSTRYIVRKNGFFEVTGALECTTGTGFEAGPNPVKTSVVLYKPEDFLSEELLSSPTDKGIRDQALKLIALLKEKSEIVEAVVVLNGVSVSRFKGKKYFQLKMKSANSFNSLKMDKYDVARILFDDSIKKILSDLDDNIRNLKSIYGYDLIIYGGYRNFAEAYEYDKNIEYRFLVPQVVARKYKDKDISGQQLLNKSVILMDEERIDLKLQ